MDGHKVSILRYPGSKRWCLNHAERFISGRRVELLLEPFAGGASVGLSLLSARAVDHLLLVEKDQRVIAFWRAVLNDPTFADRIARFNPTRANVENILQGERDGFWLLVKSRCSYRGILQGGLPRDVSARWCVDTVTSNIRRVYALRDRITVVHGDGVQTLYQYRNERAVFAFVDPPYSTTHHCPGRKLYQHFQLNHRFLFQVLRAWRPASFLLTYNNARLIRRLARQHCFQFKRVAMRTGANLRKKELLIWKPGRAAGVCMPSDCHYLPPEAELDKFWRRP